MHFNRLVPTQIATFRLFIIKGSHLFPNSLAQANDNIQLHLTPIITSHIHCFWEQESTHFLYCDLLPRQRSREMPIITSTQLLCTAETSGCGAAGLSVLAEHRNCEEMSSTAMANIEISTRLKWTHQIACIVLI